MKSAGARSEILRFMGVSPFLVQILSCRSISECSIEPEDYGGNATLAERHEVAWFPCTTGMD
jgi:hypothetical protein